MSRRTLKAAVVGLFVLLSFGILSVPSPSAEPPPDGKAKDPKQTGKAQPPDEAGKPDPTLARLEKLLEGVEGRLGQRFKGLEDRLLQLEQAKAGMGERFGAAPGGMPMPRADQRVGKGRGWQPRSKQAYAHAMKRFATARKFAARHLPRVRANELPEDFDLRTKLPSGVRLHVRNQKACGSCWDFAAVAAFEASYAKQFGKEVYVSEQYVLNGCAALGRGNCEGALVDSGVLFLADFGATGRPFPNDDYLAVEGPFSQTTPAYTVALWKPVSPDDPDAPIRNPTLLKQAVYEHGAVVVGINASDGFEHFGDNPANKVWTRDDGEPDETHGHVVAIIGWNDKLRLTDGRTVGAWLVKNSWGPGWGHNAGFGDEGGYLWVKYGVNVIGREAVWLDAAGTGQPPTIQPPTIQPPVQPCSNRTETERRLSEWQSIEGGKYLPQ